jgi:WD40 repeat protein
VGPTDDATRPQTPGDAPSAPTLRLRGRAVEPVSSTPPTLPAPERDARAWPQVPGYEIVAELGRGGMGVVYQARQLALNRVVALKMLGAGPGADADLLARFRAEAEVLARLQHPNIIQVYEVGTCPAGPYFVLEFAEGGSLARAWDGAPQAPRPAAALVETLARAVHAAHAAGVVHRDLKPANVLLTAKPQAAPVPKITDFGLARRLDAARGLTLSGQVMGTPGYMPPEQASGSGEVGPATDVYALGVLLYEALTGRPPYCGTTPLEAVHLMLSREPVAPSRLQGGVPRDLETVCLKCLEKDPRRRYLTARDVADDLARFLRGEPTRARPLQPWERAGRWARRHPLTAALAGAVVVITAVAFVLVTALWQRAESAHQFSVQRHREALAIARAEADARDRAERLSTHLLLERGLRLCEAHDPATGLLWLARALEAAPERSDLRQSVRLLLGGWGQELHPLRQSISHGGAVVALAYADPRTLVSIGAGQVQRWRLPEGRPSGPARPLDGRLLALARYQPAGASHVRLAALVRDRERTVRVVDLESGPVGPGVVLSARARGAALSADGQRLLTADNDGRVRLWHVPSGALGADLGRHAEPARAVAFSADGRRAASGGNDRLVFVYDLPAAGAAPAPGRALRGHQGPILCLAFSPDGALLATGSDDRVALVWDVISGARRHRLRHQHGVCSLSYSPDGRSLATGSYDDLARVWDAATGRPVGVPIRHADDVDALTWSPDGRHLVTAGESGSVRVWELARPAPLRESLPHPAAVLSVAVHPDGRVLTGCADNVVRLWDSSGPRPVGYRCRAHTVAFSPDGARFLLAGADRTARLFDTATGRPIGRPMEHDVVVFGAAFSPDGRYVLTGCDDKDRAAHLWDTKTGRHVRAFVGHRRKVVGVAFSPDGTLAATASWDRTARLWDVATGRQVGPDLPHQDLVQSVAFRPDGRVLASGGDDYTARLWDVETGQLIGRPLRHPGKVQVVGFSADGRLLLTGTKEKLGQFWEVATGNPAGPPLPHNGEVHTLCFAPDGRTVWTACWGGTARRWEVPQPVKGPLAGVHRWLHVHTGHQLDDSGGLVILEQAEWTREALRWLR